MKKRKLNTFIDSSKDWKFGDFIIFQEYDKENDGILEVSKPIVACFINTFVADQTIGMDFIKWTKDFPKDQPEISCHIEWSSYIDVLGHFTHRPTWKEILQCFRKQNFDKTITSQEIKWDNIKELDWKDIKVKYPKSFEKLVKDHETNSHWGCIDNPVIWDEFVYEEHYVMRHLFDFFDKHKIIIDIDSDFTRVGYGSVLYCYSVNIFETSGFDKPSGHSELYRSRQDAEVEAFMKAFELLETKLK